MKLVEPVMVTELVAKSWAPASIFNAKSPLPEVNAPFAMFPVVPALIRPPASRVRVRAPRSTPTASARLRVLTVMPPVPVKVTDVAGLELTVVVQAGSAPPVVL